MALPGPLETAVATLAVAPRALTRDPSTWPNTYATLDTAYAPGATQTVRPSIYTPLTIGVVVLDLGVVL